MCRLTKAGLHADDALAMYTATNDEAAAAVLAKLRSGEAGNAGDLAAVAACEPPPLAALALTYMKFASIRGSDLPQPCDPTALSRACA